MLGHSAGFAVLSMYVLGIVLALLMGLVFRRFLFKGPSSGFVLEPTTDMAYIAERYGHSHFFIGNADTRILLSGSKAAIRAEVERCMAIGKDKPGFFLAVGNHIPANTPVEACLYYNEVYEELSVR